MECFCFGLVLNMLHEMTMDKCDNMPQKASAKERGREIKEPESLLAKEEASVRRGERRREGGEVEGDAKKKKKEKRGILRQLRSNNDGSAKPESALHTLGACYVKIFFCK